MSNRISINMSNRISINRSLSHILLVRLTASEYQLAGWLIDNMDSANNLVIARRSDIIKKTGQSSRVVNNTIKKMRKADLIKARTGVLMISPQLAVYNSNLKVKDTHRRLTHLYKDFSIYPF